MFRTATAVLAAATLTACASPAPPATQAPPTQAPSSSMPVRDAVYLSVMRQHFAPARMSDALLFGARRETCREFRDGMSWVGMVAILVKDAGFSGRDAGFAITVAVRTGCPQFLALLPGG